MDKRAISSTLRCLYILPICFFGTYVSGQESCSFETSQPQSKFECLDLPPLMPFIHSTHTLPLDGSARRKLLTRSAIGMGKLFPKVDGGGRQCSTVLAVAPSQQSDVHSCKRSIPLKSISLSSCGKAKAVKDGEDCVKSQALANQRAGSAPRHRNLNLQRLERSKDQWRLCPLLDTEN